jgi:hypothetical protein
MRQPIALVGLLMGVSLFGGAACGGDTPAAAPSTTETVAMPPTVIFDKATRTLDVGGVRLDQFQRYQESEIFEIPQRWPATSKVVIESSVERPKHPKIAAVAFKDLPVMRTGGPEDFDQLMNSAEAMVLDERRPPIAEDTVEAAGRSCRYRVRDGFLGQPDVNSASGVIIVLSGDQPAFGLHIHGSRTEDVERLTVEIARQLCAGSGEGA